jgi:hypothetical protein
MGWLRTVFLAWKENLCRKFQYKGPIIRFLDRDASHIKPQVFSYTGSQVILIIQLVADSSHISQPLDLCAFRIFKSLYQTKTK